MYKKVYSAATTGVNAQLVAVEIDISNGLLQWNIVGLADTAIKESKQRIAAALKNSGIKIPDKKITINLAPADLKKEGSIFDLPIAVGILLAANVLSVSIDYLEETLWLGELALDGSVQSARGILPIACDALLLGKKRLVVPQSNTGEACAIEGIEVIPVKNITELIMMFQGSMPFPSVHTTLHPSKEDKNILDFEEVKGQESAKRALQIAVAGRHNIMLVGSPGSGKTMLSERVASIMPSMTKEEQVEVSKLYSISGMLSESHNLIQKRPFRAPHHSISSAGLLGGGSIPHPGEISFAHHGVLFLDELLEFKRSALEQLRQPLEKRSIIISRAQGRIEFPANFLLIAAMNPCPCGFYGDTRKQCSCASHTVEKYLQKLSGPLLDRIDLQIGVQSLVYENLHQTHTSSSSKILKEGVERARNRQIARCKSHSLYNAYLSPKEIDLYCPLSSSAQLLLKNIFENRIISMRGYHKLIKVARTIADIEGLDIIQEAHVQEACMYRTIDNLISQCKSGH